MRIGDRMAIAARLKGITQAELAEKLDVSASAVSAWAKEGRNPPSKRIPEIAAILGVSVEYLLTGKGEPSDPCLVSACNNNFPNGEKSDEQQLPQSGKSDISECLTIIKEQQSTIAIQSTSLANMIATHSRFIEVFAVEFIDNKKRN
jgi:transcriptional regulator with XRE-family HTH domain